MTPIAAPTVPAVPARADVAARAVDARRSYGSGDAQVHALDGVSVSFERGRFTAIMGPSGSGRSTLMHCLAGLDTLTNRQLRRTVGYESTIIALLGTTLGLALGVFSGWLVGQAGRDEFPVFDIPLGTLAAIAGIGVLAGLASGILPARRATRIEILDAVAAD